MPWPVGPGSRPPSSHRGGTPVMVSRPSSRSSACSVATPRSVAARDSLADELGDGDTDGLGGCLATELGGGEWAADFEAEYFGTDADYDDVEGYDGYDDENGGGDGQNEVAAADQAGTTAAFPTYDGSEYGEPGMSAELDSAIRALNRVVRQTVEQAGFDCEDGPGCGLDVPVELTMLPSQAAVEAGVTRLVATHSAVAGHLNHQTRVLASLSSALLSPLAPAIDPEEAAELASLVSDLVAELPRPTVLSAVPQTIHPSSRPNSATATAAPSATSTHPIRHRQTLSSLPAVTDSDIPPVPQSALVTLHNVYASTTGMLRQLSQLADSLHVFRQSHASASKRLTATRMIVHSLRCEIEEADRAERYIDLGDWDRKLRDRDVSTECRRVVEGFEDMWNKRLAVVAGSVCGT